MSTKRERVARFYSRAWTPPTASGWGSIYQREDIVKERERMLAMVGRGA
jgi:hypothetical protein